MAIDYTTDIGKLRVLIGDTDEASGLPFFMSDAELNVLLSLNVSSLYLAAAEALEIMATKSVMIQQKIKTLDLQTDGPAMANALLARAKDMRSRADVVDVGDDFELVDVVNSSTELFNGGYWQ